MFDIPWSDGKPLPELDMVATGDADGFVTQLTSARDLLWMAIRIV